MAVVADLKAVLTMDASRFNRGAQQAEQSLGKMSGNMGRLAGAAKAAFGAAGVGMVANWGAQLFKLGVEAEAWGRRFDTVFGEAAAGLRQWADEMNEGFGVSNERLEGMLSSVGDLLVPLGLTRRAAADMSRQVLTLAEALSEWVGGARSAEEVTSILAKSMLGERDALKELGVNVLESEVQAALLAKGMQGLTGDAMAQAKALVTLEIIQRRSADAMAAYESGAGGAMGASQQMKAALDDLKVSAGQAVTKLAPLVGVFASMVGGINDLASGDLDAAFGWQVTTMIDQEALAAARLAAGLLEGGAAADEALRSLLLADNRWSSLAFRADEFRAAIDAVRSGIGVGAARQQTVWEWLGIGGDTMLRSPIHGIFRESLFNNILPSSWSTELSRQIVYPIEQARKNAIEAVGDMFDDFDHMFTAFELPEIEWADLVANAQEWYAAQQRVTEFMRRVGEFGVIGLVAGLSSLTAEQVAFIAANWDGKLSSLLALFQHVPQNTGGGYGFEPQAEGGPVYAGRGYLVGERGPELFMPNKSGTIIPNSNLGSSGGGTTQLVVNVGHAWGDDSALERKLRTALQRAAGRGVRI